MHMNPCPMHTNLSPVHKKVIPMHRKLEIPWFSSSSLSCCLSWSNLSLGAVPGLSLPLPFSLFTGMAGWTEKRYTKSKWRKLREDMTCNWYLVLVLMLTRSMTDQETQEQTLQLIQTQEIWTLPWGWCGLEQKLNWKYGGNKRELNGKCKWMIHMRYWNMNNLLGVGWELEALACVSVSECISAVTIKVPITCPSVAPAKEKTNVTNVNYAPHMKSCTPCIEKCTSYRKQSPIHNNSKIFCTGL